MATRAAELSPTELNALVIAAARESLVAFIVAMFPGYKPLPVHYLIARKLEAVERGDIRRLILCMPPQHGKSTLASEFFPAWCLGRRASRNVASATYSQEKADDWGGRIKSIVANPLFTKIFPEFEQSPGEGGKRKWETTDRGGYAAVGIGGPLTGRPVDIGIVDDPYKDDVQADSAAWRRQVQNWYQSVLSTRIDQHASLVLILTRWREDDLAGWLLETQKHDGWELLSIPALAESDDPLGRAIGECLWPARFPSDYLLNRRLTLGTRKFTAMYQQKPTVAEGSIFKREWWRRYNPEALPHVLGILTSWDTAQKTSDDNDQSACTIWAVSDRGLYLLEHWTGKLQYGELKRKIIATHRSYARRYGNAVTLIEDKSSGISLLQDIPDEAGDVALIPINPGKIDKVARAEASTPTIEAGQVFVPDSLAEGYEWAEDFVDELASFPHGRYRDTADSVSQIIRYYASRYTHIHSPYTYESVAGTDNDNDDDGFLRERSTW